MARYEFKLPDIGEGIAEAEIVAWHVKVGDTVEEDQPLADMMTDKATVEMESPVAGKVVGIAGEVGDQIAIGSVLVTFETDAAAAEAAAEEAESAPTAHVVEVEAPAEAAVPVAAAEAPAPRGEGQVLASPAVRARARDLGIDLSAVRPVSGGRVRHSDLDAFLLYSKGAAAPSPRRAAKRADETVKVVGLRRKIAENMAEAKRRIPHFAYVEEVDVTALEALRATMNGTRGERPKLTMLPFLISALCKALPGYPQINATFDDDAGVVTRHGAVHMGMATQTDNGLAVPVLRDAQDKDMWSLAADILRLAETTRAGKTAREELSGSTITLSSLGPMGGVVSTPVINRPEVAIVAVNKVMERPVVVDGRIEVRKMMNLSSSFDHRVVDGWDAASFIQEVKRLLENPALLFAG
jgi:2-oxoisovalerate dehydrogenase E2 component (dihydrolipoyl transacylase)